MTSQPAHSPRGASSAERWLNCPGSVALIQRLALPEAEGEEWRKEGTAAHEANCRCLREGLDAWELVNTIIEGVTITAEISKAMQVYLDTCRSLITPHGQTLIETRISSDAHPDFYGTVDFAHVADSLLNVVDYKHGEGVHVSVENNPQIMYYAFGILERFPEVRRVVMRVVQPRHVLGGTSRWECSAENLHQWAENELLPAMRSTSDDLLPGEHCRFCPAKLICPVLVGMFEASCRADPARIVDLTNDQLGMNYSRVAGVKQYLKALEAETFRRLMLVQSVKGTKLVDKKANRVWKDQAIEVFKARFGAEAYHPAELRSPAEMEKIGPDAKSLVKEWAFTPKTGYTVALESDKRLGVKLQSPSEVFANIGDE